MRRTWTGAGRRYTATDNERRRVERAISQMEWRPLPLQLGAGVAAAIRAFCDARGITPIQVAISWDLQPFGLYGIEARYTNGRARTYIVDEGDQVVPVASDFWED